MSDRVSGQRWPRSTSCTRAHTQRPYVHVYCTDLWGKLIVVLTIPYLPWDVPWHVHPCRLDSRSQRERRRGVQQAYITRVVEDSNRWPGSVVGRSQAASPTKCSALSRQASERNPMKRRPARAFFTVNCVVTCKRSAR